MKKLLTIIMLCLPMTVLAQWQIDPADYAISQQDIDRAQRLLDEPLASAPVYPNPSAGAQWYPEASLGLFMHWGIHSVAGVQPSWNMIKGYRYQGRPRHTRKSYYALAKKFNPQNYLPIRYLKDCKRAGFTYAVLTTRHHDGYALWPSRYGIGTKQYLGGRDLVKEYVDACRQAGLRVGFYFSPGDWHYPNFMRDEDFVAKTRGREYVVTDSAANYQEYVKFLAYVMAQIEELLTNYGKIDVLWLDGMQWHGVQEVNTDKIYAWIRSLQPDIVINDRWANIVTPDNPAGTSVRIGDFVTPFECTKPTYVPFTWWEYEDLWTDGGGWGYARNGRFRPMKWFFDRYVAARSLGGNFLVNVGPDANGNMHPNFYHMIDSLQSWMIYGRESVFGTQMTPGPELSNVPLTRRGQDTLYAHAMPTLKGQVSIKVDKKPREVLLLRTLKPLQFFYRDGYLHFALPKEERTPMDDVARIVF